MPRISMDGQENELSMVVLKNEITYIFYWSRLIYCKPNSAASSTMHGETHGGGWVVPSLIVAENRAIGFACTFFLDSGDIAAASHSGREPRLWQKEGGATFLW
jgi:hypothetical protein